MVKAVDEQIENYVRDKSVANYDALLHTLRCAYSRLVDYKLFLEILPKTAYSYKAAKKETKELTERTIRLRKLLFGV